jgi:hypothetical protein
VLFTAPDGLVTGSGQRFSQAVRMLTACLVATDRRADTGGLPLSAKPRMPPPPARGNAGRYPGLDQGHPRIEEIFLCYFIALLISALVEDRGHHNDAMVLASAAMKLPSVVLDKLI